MSITQLQVQGFMKRFTGSTNSYGEFIYSDVYTKGKREGTASTIKNKLITLKNFKDHLDGKKGLGIIPIAEDSTCRFAVIDVDIYNINLDVYIKAIDRAGFPLVTFLSKSGGLHLYFFLKDSVNAKRVIDLMRKMSALLSIDLLVKQKKDELVEIFPKQISIKPGEFGNWINLPYYNGNNGTAVAIKGGEKLSLNDALLFIESKVISIEDAEILLNNLPFSDAPPCLQRIYFLNNLDENSGRNNFLFSFGVYLKKKDENYFDQGLLEVNNSLSESLPDNEVERTILKSLRKKDYIYKCKESPCHDFCDKKICKIREFGIGKDDGHFSTIEFGLLLQYNMATPYYEWEVRKQTQQTYTRLRFKSEQEIIKQDMFLSLTMRHLHELPPKLKQVSWYKIVNQALSDVRVVNVDMEDDTSPEMILHSAFIRFITESFLADTPEQVEIGRVYYDEPNRIYYFKMKAIINYFMSDLSLNKYFRPNELRGIVQDIGCNETKIALNINNKKRQVRVRSIKREIIEKYEDDKYNSSGLDLQHLESQEEF